MSKFLLYLGIILIFTGIGTGVGIFLVIFYFWDDTKKSIIKMDRFMAYKNYLSEKKSNPKYYNEDTAEEMK
jgi:hypothetical protein